MKNYSTNNSSNSHGFDEMILLAQYLNAKRNLDDIFNKTSKLGAMYLYRIPENESEETFLNVMKTILEAAQKLGTVTKDRNIHREDHYIFYTLHKGNFYRGLQLGSYYELRLANNTYERNFTFPSVEIYGVIDYNIEKLGGEN